MPTWSILIPTLSSRHEYLKRLLDVLLPQAEQAGGAVEVVALHNDGNWPLIEIRQALLDDAKGDWLSFVDDDDLVAADYVSAVLACLAKDPDYVAFQHAIYWDGTLDPRPVHTGIQLGGWYDKPLFYARDVTHVQPVRSSIARQAGFRIDPESGWEDRGYDFALRPLIKTQETIPRVMYHYFHRSTNTTQTYLFNHAYAPRPPIDSPVFRWHEMSTG